MESTTLQEVSSPTYESYCRERKSHCNKHQYNNKKNCPIQHTGSRSMSEVVDEILEIISTDEDHIKNDRNKRESTTFASSVETSYSATWSLSSSAIVTTTWPTQTDSYNDESELVTDDIDALMQRTILSYTSQLFSPLYEVQGVESQKNVFQENRQPLPKPGYTPKIQSLCYPLATEFSYDNDDEQKFPHDLTRLNQQQSPLNQITKATTKASHCKDVSLLSADKTDDTSPSKRRAHQITERIMSSLNPLAVITNENTSKVAATIQQAKVELPMDSCHYYHHQYDNRLREETFQLHLQDLYHDEEPIAKFDDSHHNINNIRKKLSQISEGTSENDYEDDCLSDIPLNQLPQSPLLPPVRTYPATTTVTTTTTNDEEPYILQRRYDDDWMYKTMYNHHTAACSADSGELSLEPLLNGYSEDDDLLVHDATVVVVEEEDDDNHRKDICDIDGEICKNDVNCDRDRRDDDLFKVTSNAASVKEKDTNMNNFLLPSSKLEKKTTDDQLDRPQMIPTNKISTLRITNPAIIQRIPMDIPMTPTLLHAIDESFAKLQEIIAKSLIGYSVLVKLEKKKIGGSNTIDDTDQNVQLESNNINNVPSTVDKDVSEPCYLLDFDAVCSPSHINLTDLYVDSGCEEQNSLFTCGGERQFKTIIRPISDDEMEIRFDIDSSSNCWNDDENKDAASASADDADVDAFDRLLADGLPEASFDSVQFLKDMALRIEEDLMNGGIVNSYSDDEIHATLLPQQYDDLSINFLSNSAESNDGLDEELNALGKFEADLRNQIDKVANDLSKILTISSPAPREQLSSSRSMNSLFSSDLDSYLVSRSHHHDQQQIPFLQRRVHFNEQVEEFLYIAQDVCNTPNATNFYSTSNDNPSQQNTNETFMDEILSVIDDVLDEFSSACTYMSNAMDRTKTISKNKPLRRSSMY